jgi:phosphoribosylglycinamide formyltransferase-1
MKIVCFVSGSGTNYGQIALKNPAHQYLVFTNRPDCGGVMIARENRHPVVQLSHIPYLRDARRKYGPGNVPRNCPEREQYEKDALRLIEGRLGGRPDLVCLAGYDQWTTDWMVDAYYPRVLNVHPGDTTKGYTGFGWMASVKAILAGDDTVRSTLFIVDKGEDNGPVLAQSMPLNIHATLSELDSGGSSALVDGLRQFKRFVGTSYEDFRAAASPHELALMKLLGEELQGALKIAGDWEIYPYAVKLIAEGAVEVEGRSVFVNGRLLPEFGLRMEEI